MPGSFFLYEESIIESRPSLLQCCRDCRSSLLAYLLSVNYMCSVVNGFSFICDNVTDTYIS